MKNPFRPNPGASSGPFTAKLDRDAELRMLAAYDDHAVQKIMEQAAESGGKQAAKVLKDAAPIGTARRLSQFYRRQGLQHGTFRSSVRAAKIRGRGSALVGLQGRTIGYVVGPIGSKAFTRHWIESGTSHQRANPWIAQTASAALSVARDASDAVLTLYAKDN